ncbi:MAG: serine hydroxymethyltransferase [Deltaproteobacteria bacterium]|nr:serine hydroxymethyltransferase [Deltaproteobacteria bacterium]
MAKLEALQKADPDVFALVRLEEKRQRETIRLIPSENYVSAAVLDASGTVLTNNYSEGYPGKRYYQGQEFTDRLEEIARTRATALFGADHANVQPYSGSPANLAVHFALAKPGDTTMGLALPHGGHLTHGWGVSITGTYWKPVRYALSKETGRIDYDDVRRLALEARPRLIWCGATAYPRVIEFETMGAIAREVGALLCADIAHIAGLVAAGVHPSPVAHADVVTTTTHKTLRGPRGGMILCKKEHAAAIDKAVFPGLQGGPHDHTTAAIAVALGEAATPAFRNYAAQIVRNAKVLAEELLALGFSLVTGGTDNHLILIDLTNKGVAGKPAAQALERAGLVLNYNAVPFDPRKPFDPSGIRLGTPAATSRGMREPEMRQITRWMGEVIKKLGDDTTERRIAGEVREFCARFPAPGLAAE